MEYAELTGNVLAFTRQSAADLKCKFKHNADFICCASYSFTRKTWKIGVLNKPYSPRDIRGLNFYVPQPTVEEDFTRQTDSSNDEESENENIGTPNSTSTSQTVLSPSDRRHKVHTIQRVFLGNIFWDHIKANPSFKLRHMQTILRNCL